ncbi:MAG: SHOCT domain-containing protein [Gammaproteobacteria bacterium]
MENGTRRIALASALLTLAWWGSVAWAATEAPRGVVVLWTGEDQWVKIERQDDPAASPNDHPAPLGTAAVASALGALRVRLVDPDTGAETQRAVFAHEELGSLAPQLAAGLAKAGPRQDVTFSTIGSHPLGGGGLVKDPGVNAGRVFYEDGKLNVIFGELQGNYRKRNVFGRRDQDFDPRRQGARAKASEQKWTLATRPGITFHATRDGSIRSDWVTIDAAVAASQTAAAAPTAGAATGPAATTATAGDLERRLQVLKDLKDKGLISEEAYNARVQELLSEL